MSKSRFSNYTVTSGRNVGKHAKKTVGCEECNFMMDSKVWKLEYPNSKKITGSECPRCKNQTIRLYDSNAEFQYARELKIKLDEGEIEDLEYQPKFRLHAPQFETGTPVHLYDYIADFAYFEHGKDGKLDYKVVDVKNKSMVITDIAKMKMTHFEAEYGMEVNIVGR